MPKHQPAEINPILLEVEVRVKVMAYHFVTQYFLQYMFWVGMGKARTLVLGEQCHIFVVNPQTLSSAFELFSNDYTFAPTGGAVVRWVSVGAFFSCSALRSSSSSGVPSLHAHASMNLKVSRFQILFINRSRRGTRAMIINGKAGAPFVSVTTKMTTVTTICTAVYI